MLHWRKFDYHTLEELQRDIDIMGLNLPVSEDLAVLGKQLRLYGKTIKNRLAIQPMEGFDGFFDGTPSDLTFRRYRRFSGGGAGLIWFESIAVASNSKTCHRQLQITEENLSVFQRLLYEIEESAQGGQRPYMIAQLTFCGRGAHLDDMGPQIHPVPAFIAAESPYLPRKNTAIITDEEIDGVIDAYVKSAALAKAAGFDAVDVRACHGYFLSEILSAFTRPGKYGGSFENRTRMMLEIIDRIQSEVGIPVATRLNACDFVPYPYGWGMKTDGSMEPDLTEPFRLAELLLARGVKLMNISVGRNHVGHIQSPADRPDFYPQEHQLTSIALFQDFAARFKKKFPEAVFMTGNFAWTRQFSAQIAAGGIQSESYDIAGFARLALAYPDFAKDILQEGRLIPEKCCTTCGMCGELCASTSVVAYPVGCVARNPKQLNPYYKAWKSRKGIAASGISPEKTYPLKLFHLSSVPPEEEEIQKNCREEGA